MAIQELSEVPIGTRVVVRYLIEGGERATDVMGPLVARSDSSVTVEATSGPVDIAVEDIVAGKPIPPPAARRGRRR